MPLFNFLGGIQGQQQGKEYNSKAAELEEELEELSEEEADIYNEGQQQILDKQLQRFEEALAWNFETLMQNWDLNVRAQEYEYKKRMEMYEKDQERVYMQMDINDTSLLMAREGIQRQLEEVKKTKQFDATTKAQEALVKMGEAQLGQAGQSSARLVNAHMAELGKSIAMMDASMNSAITQANVDMFQQTWHRDIDNYNTWIGQMYKPEKPEALEMPRIPKTYLPEFELELEERDPRAIGGLGRKNAGSGQVWGGLLRDVGGIIGMF